MTNAGSIRIGQNDEFNKFLVKATNEELAEMLSTISCEKCICHEYCHEVGKENMTCQGTIITWLKEQK